MTKKLSRKEIQDEMRIGVRECKKCGIKKEIDNFGVYKIAGRKEFTHRRTCKQCRRTWEANRYALDPNLRITKNKTAKIYHLSKYNLSQEQYDNLTNKQKGLCLICNIKPLKGILHIDHCHKTGKVRGLLCGTCNRGIGMFKENKKLLIKAIEYLESNCES